MALWSGRFSKELDNIAKEYNSSIAIDQRMYKVDIQGSMAHAKMLAQTGIINEDELGKILGGLSEILKDIESGKLEIDLTAEDIHMFVEKELTDRVGEPGKKLHTARSRNDQVAVDIRLYLREYSAEIENSIKELINSIINLAEKNINTIMPGYTHLQAAQPISFAHHLMAYGQMLRRDLSRLEDSIDRMNVSPLGSCAFATTTYPIDRFMTAELLGFKEPMAML